jgi:hypothetical protein
LIGVIAVAFVLAAPRVQAQWEKVPHPSVPRTRTGEAILTAPAPKARARTPDLSGVWVADSEPVPPEAGLTVEGDMPFPRYMINVLADVLSAAGPTR